MQEDLRRQIVANRLGIPIEQVVVAGRYAAVCVGKVAAADQDGEIVIETKFAIIPPAGEVFPEASFQFVPDENQSLYYQVRPRLARLVAWVERISAEDGAADDWDWELPPGLMPPT